MAYSYYNGDCYNKDCKNEHGEHTYVYKGPDSSIVLWVDGALRIFCVPCGEKRQTNKNKGTSKRAYVKRQPTLFD